MPFFDLRAAEETLTEEKTQSRPACTFGWKQNENDFQKNVSEKVSLTFPTCKFSQLCQAISG